MSSNSNSNRQIAEAFFVQLRLGTPNDITALEALLVMAEEHGAAMVEWACDVDTVERTCPDVIFEASSVGAMPVAAILERP